MSAGCSPRPTRGPALLQWGQRASAPRAQAPETAGRCVRFFNRNDHAPSMLRGVHYAVLGLGDSNLLLDRQTTTAKDCNAVAQRLERNLKQLGAARFSEYAEADDRTGNREVEPWLAKVLVDLQTRRYALCAEEGAAPHEDGDATAAGEATSITEAAAAEALRIDQLAAKWLSD